jgi:ankyrin repeat protein
MAVSHDRPEILQFLLQFGLDPDERTRFRDVGVDDIALSWGMPLWHCAAARKHEMADMLLAHGADPNAAVYASGTPIAEAFGQGDWRMIALLEEHGGRVEPSVAAQYRQLDRVTASMAAAPDKAAWAEMVIGPAACGGSPDIVRLALAHLEWPRDDPRWFGALEQPLRIWHHSGRHWARPDWDRAAYQTCFRMILDRCNPNIRGRNDGVNALDLTVLHSVAGSRDHVTADERLAFATMLLDAGASLDVRDEVLKSTPLGWACRWGRVELVRLYLARGADPAEADSESWAKPIAWAEKKGHREIVELLLECARR